MKKQTLQKGSHMAIKKSTTQAGRKLGYARVSTDKQTARQQVRALKKAGCAQVFVDEGVRATAKHRPALERLNARLCEGDIFVVWGVDRAFRSTMEAIAFLDDLHRRGIEFKSLTQNIDTRTPEGRKWYIDTASWAEYERAMISRRTKEKMADSIARGVHVGRPYKLSKRKAANAFRTLERGAKPLPWVAQKYGVSPRTLRRTFAHYGFDAAEKAVAS